ncbi:hypothetical protein SPBRAN_1702 [uncultured Candidatus Thioglobus sp.]|nr:hypothetical protein SPBRAN_1702 [uncultured Candidatus Thioglobus sp.]
MNIEQDKIINAIEAGAINKDNVSFELIKRVATTPTPPDVHRELDYGHAILDTQDQLNKYVYAYGSMIFHQWIPMFNQLNLFSSNVVIIDYACGQGLASMLFFDKHKDTNNCSNITLIEPSKIALNRAEKILQCYLPKAKIKTINKVLDDVTKNDIQTDDNAIKIHLFSNIIDMNVFNIKTLFDKITVNKGRNYFIAMSSDRNSFGGTERLDDLHNNFDKNSHLYKIIKIETDSFVMENPSTHPGAKDFNIRFVYIEIEV